MIPFHCILAFLIVLNHSSAEPQSRFYARMDRFLKPISYFNQSGYLFITVLMDKSHKDLYFHLNDGVASVGEHETKKVFGITKHGVLAFGKKDNLDFSELKMELDLDSKVLNLHPYYCQWAESPHFRGTFLVMDRTSRNLKCVPVDIYYLSFEERDKFRAVSWGRQSHGAELRTT